MTHAPYYSGPLALRATAPSSRAAWRGSLCSQASRLTLRSIIAAATVAGVGLLAPGQAWAQCLVGATTVTCGDTITTNTTSPVNAPNDRNYPANLAGPVVVTINPGATVSGNGLAVSNAMAGGITVTNNGAIGVDAGNTPTAGGTAALSITAAGGAITYVGGSIINNGNGNAFDATQTGGVGSVNINISGNTFAAAGSGIVVEDVATSTGISVTTGAVTALTLGRNAIDVRSMSTTGDVTEVANGNLQAGNSAMVAQILSATATGNVDVTANGSIDARFGVDAQNHGAGNTTVTTVGPVNVTNGAGINALSTDGNVTVTAGDVTSIGNLAILAEQTKAGAAGTIDVTAGNVSGTVGIFALDMGTGAVSITANGTVTGTNGEAMYAFGNDAVTVSVADTVSGATNGLILIGGIGGAGNISVTGTGGFVGGTSDAADIQNNGAGTVTVDISGASSSAGGEGVVVDDTTIGGDISVTTGAVSALTLGKDAIDVRSLSLTGNVTIVANGNLEAGNAGLLGELINGTATGNVDVTANGSIDSRLGVDAENHGAGNTTVTTVGPVNVTNGPGINALTNGGDVTVTAGDVTSVGSLAILAEQTKAGAAGTVDVTAGNVSGTTGINALDLGTGAVSITANGTVTGTVGDAIYAFGNDAVTVSVADTVSGATNGMILIGGTGGTGNIAVTGTGGFVGDFGDAANILNNGLGTTIVDISGASSSTGGNGFVVRDTAVGGGMSVTTGAVTALVNDFDVQSLSNTGNVTIVANGNLQAGGAGMVAIIGQVAATGNIDATANGSIDARFGIDAENYGSGNTNVTTNGVNATSGNGIFAQTAGGTVTVNAGDVTSTGNTAIIGRQINAAGAGTIDLSFGNVSGTTGVEATNSGTGAISVTANGAVTGTAADGIDATGNNAVSVSVADTVTGATNGLTLIGGTGGAGNISVTGTGGFVGGTGDGANILNNGTGTVTVDISGASSSTGGEGVVVRDTVAGGNISVNTGAVTALSGTNNAIDVQSHSNTGNVTIVANNTLRAGNGGVVVVISPSTATGNIDLTANGSIDASLGIFAENIGAGTTSVAAVGPITTTAGYGIYAHGHGDVTVTAGDVTSVGNFGIFANQSGATTATVDVTAGNVSGTTGILAATNGTGIGAVSVTTHGTVVGTVNEGIKAIGNSDVSVTVDQSVTGATTGLMLSGGNGGTGDVNVSGTGGFVGGTGDAADILNFGSGKVIVDISGASSSTGGYGIVAGNSAIGGDMNVTTGAVTALTAGKNAIDVESSSDTANLTVVANGDVHAGKVGVETAIISFTAAGNLAVTTGGSVDGMTGIDATNLGAGTVTVTTHGTVTGTAANGIFAFGGGAVTLTADRTVTGATDGLYLVGGNSGAGNISVTDTGGFVGGTGPAAVIENDGTGSVTVAISGASGSTGGNGLVIGDTSVGGDIDVTTGAISTPAAGMNAIDIRTQSLAANVTVVAGGDIQAGGFGIEAAVLPNAATGNVDVTANAAVAGRYGVDAENHGAGSVTVETVGPVTATDGYGVIAQTSGGNIKLITGDVTSTDNIGVVGVQIAAATTGTVDVTANGNVLGTIGIEAASAGTGNITIRGAGSATATFSEGIIATASSGNADVLFTGTVASASGGIEASSISGNVTVAGTGAVTVDGAIGIFGFSDTGNVTIAPASTVTSNIGTGIRGAVNGAGNTTITTAGAVTSNFGTGVIAIANDGVATITANGKVSGESGLVGMVTGSGSVAINANGNIKTSFGTGIAAMLQGAGAGTITVDQAAGTLISTTFGHGIQTDSGTSTGATTVMVAGEIKASGPGEAGVRGTSTTGAITVDVAATGTIDPAFGIALDTVGGALAVNNLGLVSGTVTGVQLVATGAGAATIANVGTIAGPNAVVGSLNGGAFTLTNYGMVSGAINVGGANIATSTWTNKAGASANLGSGGSIFSGNLVNMGTTNIGTGGMLGLLGNSTNSGQIVFTGAGGFITNGTLANSGIINAQNNVTGNVVAVVGNYSGGGQLAVDYSEVTASADHLNIGGSASGNTNVTMSRVGARSFVAGGFLPVVTVIPGAAAPTFTSNTVFETTGFVLDHFGQNPHSNTQFGLIQTINPLAAPLGDLTYMAESASAALDEPISPFVTTRNDPPAGAMRFSLWMRGGGGHTNQTIDSTLAGGGVVYSGASRIRTDHEFAQFGADLGFLNIGGGGWNVNVGAMGGWYDGQVALTSADRIKVETPFLGGYVVVGNGTASLEGSIRKEWRHYKLAMPTLFGAIGTQKLDGEATAYTLRGSYRIGGQTGFAATPFASFNYADSRIDPLAVDAFTVWTPGSDKTKIGQAGLRLSYRGDVGSGVTLEPFAGAARLENWSNSDSSTFAFGAPVTSFSLDTVTWKDAMRYSVGLLGIAAGGRVSGFVVGNIDDGSRLKSFTLNAGVRFNF